MNLTDLLGELVVERYGPTGHAKRPAPAVHTLADGGADNDVSRARRRRVLCEALEDAPVVRQVAA